MSLHLLVIESNTDDLLFLKDLIAELDGAPHWGTWTHVTAIYASNWAEASRLLGQEKVNAILLNPDLADSRGADTFRRCQALVPRSPVILLLDGPDPPLTEQLLREGAQDFITKKEVDCAPLARTLQNAVDRHCLLTATRAVAMVDLRTGLLTRDAFLLLAQRDLRLAERLRRRAILVLAEPGPAEPNGTDALDRDLKLVKAAERMRSLAGAIDLVARIDRNRLAIAILDTDQESAEEVWARMHTASSRDHISLGAAVFDPSCPAGLQDLLERAEHDLEPTAFTAVVPST
jgi:PleD family two-component response regulator